MSKQLHGRPTAGQVEFLSRGWAAFRRSRARRTSNSSRSSTELRRRGVRTRSTQTQTHLDIRRDSCRYTGRHHSGCCRHRTCLSDLHRGNRRYHRLHHRHALPEPAMSVEFAVVVHDRILAARSCRDHTCLSDRASMTPNRRHRWSSSLALASRSSFDLDAKPAPSVDLVTAVACSRTRSVDRPSPDLAACCEECARAIGARPCDPPSGQTAPAMHRGLQPENNIVGSDGPRTYQSYMRVTWAVPPVARSAHVACSYVRSCGGPHTWNIDASVAGPRGH